MPGSWGPLAAPHLLLTLGVAEAGVHLSLFLSPPPTPKDLTGGPQVLQARPQLLHFCFRVPRVLPLSPIPALRTSQKGHSPPGHAAKTPSPPLPTAAHTPPHTHCSRPRSEHPARTTPSRLLVGTWLSSGSALALSSSTTMALALNAYLSHAGIRLREARPSSTAEKAPSAPDKDKWLPFFPKTKKVTGPPQKVSPLGVAPHTGQPGRGL